MKIKAFFTCWTRKEAFVKATGRGLSLPLNEFDVSFIPGEPAVLLHVGWDTKESYRWSLQELSLGPSYVAALAVEGNSWQLKSWWWQ
jgi:4'-phosphopantetheinyl transferase